MLIEFVTPAMAADTTVQASAVYEAAVSPILQVIAGVAAMVITAAGAMAVAWLKKKLNLSDAEAQKLGLELDAQHRAAFQAALTNAGGLVIQRLGDKAATMQIDVGNPLIKAGVDYVVKSAPDAIAHFNLQGRADEIAEKIIAKLPQVSAAAPAPK